MAKEKKDGHYLNVYLDQKVYDRLTRASKETGITKTAAVEKGLGLFLDKLEEKDTKTQTTAGV